MTSVFRSRLTALVTMKIQHAFNFRQILDALYQPGHANLSERLVKRRVNFSAPPPPG